MSRRRGSAMALNVSEVAAARGMGETYSVMGIRQAHYPTVHITKIIANKHKLARIYKRSYGIRSFVNVWLLSFILSPDKGTPVARPVRKAHGSLLR